MSQETAAVDFQQQVEVYLVEGNLEKAIAVCEQGLQVHPSSAALWKTLAVVLQAGGKLDDAKQCYNKAIALQPDFVEDLINLGTLYANLQQWQNAIDCYQKALAVQPNFAGAYRNLARVFAQTGKLEAASDCAYLAFTLQPPTSAEDCLKLGNSLSEQNKLERAIICNRRAIHLNPNFYEAYCKLAQVASSLHQWDEAGVSYHKAIELQPDILENHYHLGNVTQEIELADRSIATCHRSLELNPESFLCLHQLGEAIYRRVMLESAFFFSNYKLEAIPHSEYQVNGPEPELCFLNDEAFLQATNHLDDEAYTREIYRVYLRRTVSEIEKNGCISWLQTPGNSRELGLRHWRTLPEFQSLLNKSILSVCLEQSIAYFRRAIEISPTHYQSHYRLGEVLVKQEQLDKAILIYRNLAILLAEQGRLKEAITCFQQTPRPPLQDYIYDRIWKGLNQLGILAEDNDFYPTEILAESARQYFAQTSKYTMIVLESLTDADRELIENAGFSIANLQVMMQDRKSLEEIYINSFASDEQFIQHSSEPPKLSIGLPDEWQKARYLHQSIADTGYVYTVCPVTGKVLRSNQSFYTFPGLFYRFVGMEVFYLLVGEWYGSRLCLYFPRLDLIIVLYRHDHLDFPNITNVFKSYLVSSWKKAVSYISKEKKELAAMVGLFPNPGHYLLNELSAFYNLHKSISFKNIDRILACACEYFNIDDIFPEIPSQKILRVPEKFLENLHSSILENNLFAFRPAANFIEEGVSQRIYQSSLRKCTPSFLQEVESAKQHFPLLWITIRNYKRRWLSQVEGTANIITSLHSEFPHLAVVFDGWSLTERNMGNYEPIIAVEQACLEQILALIPPTVKTYNTIGRPIYETAVWAEAIDLYVAPFGTGMTFVTWIANKPGVAHGNKPYYVAVKQSFSPLCRENIIEPVLIALNDIIEDESNPDPFTRNYDCDWRIIYNEVLKILNERNWDK
jgi:tetratricopeptide (TPR) repeat protein